MFLSVSCVRRFVLVKVVCVCFVVGGCSLLSVCFWVCEGALSFVGVCVSVCAYVCACVCACVCVCVCVCLRACAPERVRVFLRARRVACEHVSLLTREIVCMT